MIKRKKKTPKQCWKILKDSFTDKQIKRALKLRPDLEYKYL